MNPVELYWNRLGRHLLPQDEHSGDVVADTTRSLSKTYDHALTDKARALVKLARVRAEDDAAQPAALAGWAADIARFYAATELLGGDELSNDEADALRKAATKVNKAKDRMGGLRLSPPALSVIAAGQDALLVSNVMPANPAAIDHRLSSGMAAYEAALLHVLFSPPDTPFIVIEFDRTPITAGELIVNVPPEGGPPSVIRTSGPLGGVIRRDRLLKALSLAKESGLDMKMLWRLAKWEEERVASGEGDFRKLERMTQEIVVDVDDLLDALPRLDGLEWRLLRSAVRSSDATMEEPTPEAAE